MNSKPYDVAIIGGGIIGTATAMALMERFHISLVLLEAEKQLASHQSGNSSGVIHSGLYYKPGTLKARNCIEGREMMYRFCQEHGIAHECCGKLVIATHEKELPALEELHCRGIANGIQGLKWLRAEEIREHEPHASGVAGLWVPVTGIVDYAQVTQSFADITRKAGGEIRTDERVKGFKSFPGEFLLETSKGEVRCHHLINCSGLQSDRIARMCGIDPGLRIIPFRGDYYTLISERRILVRNLIYPVPNLKMPFLGVHFTRMVSGEVQAGPNAVLSLRREGYKPLSFSVVDAFQIASYMGFWRMARGYWRIGVGEFFRSVNKRPFWRALRRLIPELRPDDIHRSGAGVRAQALLPSGHLVDDFHVIQRERMIHVLNAPSPAATASISIGRTIARMAEKDFSLRGKVASP
jgi:L-2-hydroxyglutarate oxidase